jgi:hypothetical protein
VSAVGAALSFFNALGGASPTDDRLAAALGEAISAFVGVLFVGLVAYCAALWIVTWRIPLFVLHWWPAGRRFTRLSVFPMMQNTPTHLVEPPPVPAFDGCEVYGLTDQRVIILSAGKHRVLHSCRLNELEDVRCIDAGDGWGDLVLVTARPVPVLPIVPTLPASEIEREEIRLWGIERVGHVEQAIRCLLAHHPLQAAVVALSFQPGSQQVEGEHVRLVVGLQAAPAQSARKWQATLWRGPSPDQLAPLTVYGSSLAELRATAAGQLLFERPKCISNYPSSRSQSAPQPYQRLYALYTLSEKTSRGMPSHLQAAVHPLGSASRQRGAKGADGSLNSGGKDAGEPGAEQGAHTTADESQTSPQKERGLPGLHWEREAYEGNWRSPCAFAYFEDAVNSFVARDMLPTRGPAYVDDLLAQKRELFSAQTVKVVDDEALANDLLHRGGWHVFATQGMTAPRGTMGPVLFVLGHPEDGAV